MGSESGPDLGILRNRKQTRLKLISKMAFSKAFFQSLVIQKLFNCNKDQHAKCIWVPCEPT